MRKCWLIIPGLLLHTRFLFAAEAAASESPLLGRWEGSITGNLRTQAVRWQFAAGPDGRLRGFMGPASAGLPLVEMQNLVVTDDSVGFTLDSQHAVFSGSLKDSMISGVWQQTTSSPLQLRHKEFVFSLNEAQRQALVGKWQMSNPNPHPTVEFTANAQGQISGAMTSPQLPLYDIPVIDLFFTEDGHAEFATDQGRFTGRLINGVLLGEYRIGTRSYPNTLTRLDKTNTGYALTLGDSAWQKMEGRWISNRWPKGTLEFVTTADNVKQATITRFGRTTPLLVVELQRDQFSFTTLNGEKFSGTLGDNTLTGGYLNASVIYTKESAPAPQP